MFFNFSINGYPLWVIPWNLFLAAIPCVLAYRIAALRKNNFLFALVFLAWFFFLPNTVYLLTIVRHLVDYCQDYTPMTRVCFEEAWMSPFFFTYALTGLLTFLIAMKKMTAVIRAEFGKKAAKLMPIILMPFITLGMLFGLLDRLNSWDIIARPFTLISITLSYFTEMSRLTNWVVFTVILYALYYGMLAVIKKIKID